MARSVVSYVLGTLRNRMMLGCPPTRELACLLPVSPLFRQACLAAAAIVSQYAVLAITERVGRRARPLGELSVCPEEVGLVSLVENGFLPEGGR